MKKQRTYFCLPVLASIVFGIILPVGLVLKDPTLISITFSLVWFIYVILMIATTFLINAGLRIKASRQNGLTIVRYELKDPEGNK